MSNLKYLFNSRYREKLFNQSQALDKAVAEMKDRYVFYWDNGKINFEGDSLNYLLKTEGATPTKNTKRKKKLPNRGDLEIEFAEGIEELEYLFKPVNLDNKPTAQPKNLFERELKKTNLDKILKHHMCIEAENTKLSPSYQVWLVPYALDCIAWAKKEYPQLRNPQIIAAFAVRYAYDQIFRVYLSSAICDEPITSPCLQGTYSTANNGISSSAVSACKDPNIRNLIKNTNKYEVSHINKVNIVDAFCGVKTNYHWALDPIRPPIQAIRTAASLINAENETLNFITFQSTPKKVLAVETGHSMAAIALAAFLPTSDIYTYSEAYPGYGKPNKYDAIIVNLPNAASIDYRKYIFYCHTSKYPRALIKEELEVFWKTPKHKSGTHCSSIMKDIIPQLSHNGLLIVLGDIESNQLHIASSIIQKHQALQPIPIGKHSQPISYQYKDGPPWVAHGALYATGRLMQAWRKA